MSTTVTTATITPTTTPTTTPLDRRVVLSGFWVSTLFVFA